MSTQAQLEAKIKELEAKLAKKQQGGLIVKRSDKSGGIMVLGLRSFPVTFYDQEWEQLFACADKIRECAKTPGAKPKLVTAQAVG